MIAPVPPAPSAGAPAVPAIDVTAMRAAAAAAVALLRAMAHPDRLLILCELSRGERSVGDLARCLELRQPTLSQQLGVLRAEALVKDRREGKRIIYALAAPHALEVIAALQGVYCGGEPPRRPAAAAAVDRRERA